MILLSNNILGFDSIDTRGRSALVIVFFGYWFRLFFGHIEKEVRQLYKDWLDDDPTNAVFGQYRLTKTIRWSFYKSIDFRASQV